MLHESTTAALNLHTTSRLLLDIFHVLSSLTDNLSAQVETRDWLKIDGNALFWPLAPTEMIALDLWFFAAAETAFVDEVGQFLLHQFVNLFNGTVEAFFGLGGDVEIERWILRCVLATPPASKE